MIQDAFWGILIPFLGTSLGAGCVFFLKNSLRDGIQRALTGFAAGVMVAASVWSLLIPAMEQAADLGRLAFFPAAVGFWLGILFLLLLDHLIPHLHQNSLQAEGTKSQLQRTTMMVLAVTLHNIPEGMAVGVVYAGYLAGTAQITAAGALALSLGIAIQNFPEGAIISMPLRAEGMKKGRAFWGGVLSGIPEHFSGKLLEVPVGTGILTMPLYKTLPKADITCLDYSADMMGQAQEKADRLHLKNVIFQQGDVGALPYADGVFDIVLSLNGFHAFPDKEAAYREVFRVLKPGGTFCGCFYVKGEQKRTDWFVRHIYEKTGFFTPPYETAFSLKKRLEKRYATVTLGTVKSMAWFACRKAE